MGPSSQLQHAYSNYMQAAYVAGEFSESYRILTEKSKDDTLQTFSSLPWRRQRLRAQKKTPDAVAYTRHMQQLKEAEAKVHDSTKQKEAIRQALVHALTQEIMSSDPLALHVHLLLESLQSFATQVLAAQQLVPDIQKQLKSDSKREIADLFTNNSSLTGMIIFLWSAAKWQQTGSSMQTFQGHMQQLQHLWITINQQLQSFSHLTQQQTNSSIQIPDMHAGWLMNMLESFADVSGFGGNIGWFLWVMKILGSQKKQKEVTAIDAQLNAVYNGVASVYNTLELRQARYLQQHLLQFFPQTTISLEPTNT